MSYPSTSEVIAFCQWLKSNAPQFENMIPLLMRNEKEHRDALKPKRKRGVKVGLGPGGKHRAELDRERVNELKITEAERKGLDKEELP